MPSRTIDNGWEFVWWADEATRPHCVYTRTNEPPSCPEPAVWRRSTGEWVANTHGEPTWACDKHRDAMQPAGFPTWAQSSWTEKVTP